MVTGVACVGSKASTAVVVAHTSDFGGDACRILQAALDAAEGCGASSQQGLDQ